MPEADGFPDSLYIKNLFFSSILCEVYSEAFKSKPLPFTFNKTRLTICSNYSPIYLIKTGANNLTAMLINRLGWIPAELSKVCQYEILNQQFWFNSKRKSLASSNLGRGGGSKEF